MTRKNNTMSTFNDSLTCRWRISKIMRPSASDNCRDSCAPQILHFKVLSHISSAIDFDKVKLTVLVYRISQSWARHWADRWHRVAVGHAGAAEGRRSVFAS